MTFPKGIRLRLFILGALPATILAFTLTFWFIQTRITELDNALSERGKAISENLAPASIYGIFSGNDYLLQQLTDSAVLRSDVIDVAIYNKQGKRRAYSRNSLYEHATPNQGKNSSYFSYPVQLSTLREEESDPYSALSDNKTKQRIGDVSVTLSRLSTIESQTETIYISSLITFLALLFSFLLAYRLSLKISSPILDLTKTVKKVSEGDLNARSNIQALEELNELKSGLNVMAESLQKNQSQLQERIQTATQELNRSLQKLEKSNEQKTIFLAHMSHEIRTPMNGILGFLRLLSKSPLSPSQSNQLQLVETSANNLLTIINEVLDHSELESGELKLSFSNFDIRRAIEEGIVLLAPLAQEKHLDLLLLIDQKVPRNFTSDPVRVRQILFNLIGNAIKFSHSGQIIIRIRSQSGETGSPLLFTVSDCGQGVIEKEQKNLFAPFSQACENDKLPPPGTGLGLSIAQSIIKALNGEIGLASRRSIGSTFWFTLPTVVQQEITQPITFEQISPAKSQTSPSGQRKKALFIDNNKLTNLALHQQLLSVGIEPIDIDLEALTKVFINDKTGDYEHLIINIDNSQLPNNLDDLASQLPTLFVSYSSTEQGAPYNVSLLQRPCTQTALLEALSPVAAPVPQKLPSKQIQAEEDGQQPKIKFLIADDIEINRLLLIEQIKPHWQASITEAKDGEEALNQLKKQPFDLVFLDLRMPKRSGLSTLKALMSTPGALNKNTPFIAVTAFLPENSKDELASSGFSEIMIKPILEAKLVATVNNLLSLRGTKTKKTKINRRSSGNLKNRLFENLVQKVNGDEELAHSLIEKLKKELPQQLKTIQETFKAKALDEAKEIVHKIHGTACYFEVAELSEVANRLEMALDHAELKTATELLPLLEEEVARLIN